jgi:hypothetical protein
MTCYSKQEQPEVRVRRWLVVFLMCVTALSVWGQASSSNYQPGTIMAVAAHQAAGQPAADVTQYDVSIKVGHTTYVVLFTPPSGSNTVKYAVGDELLVLVGSNTVTFNSPISGKTEMPILRREMSASPKP